MKLQQGLQPIAIWIEDILKGKTTHPVPSKEKPLPGHVIEKMVKRNFHGKSFTTTNLREIIHYLRLTSDIPVLSGQKGYFTSKATVDVQENIRSLESRAHGVLEAASGLQRFI